MRNCGTQRHSVNAEPYFRTERSNLLTARFRVRIPTPEPKPESSCYCVSGLDGMATRHGDQAQLQAEVLALRRHVQVLGRQRERVRWSTGDRMVLAALRERILTSGWAGLLVKPEAVLGWHHALVRSKWEADRG